ncbi:MAG TPA: leucine-rich repeat domain-containing protein [Cyclobacteriaceae bacterium]|jgi:Leucine-rich repeat (LRR) protein
MKEPNHHIIKSAGRWIAVFLLVVVAFATAKAQKPNPAEHEQKVRDIVQFLQYVLNTIGSKETSARDKDVLIRESYTKIFRDSKVQIEDDLDENRSVITNKDVQAYLKDVDFFFEDAAFEFNIRNIKGEVNANGELFYKVTTARNLRATTIGGKQINKTIPRYIEVNYYPDQQDLKIVSIYTNVFDESKALQSWWSQLSYEWQSIFKRRLGITADSVTLDDIQNITSIDALDLSDNRYLRDIEPLAELSNLKTLDLSGTGITDLTPIRNLTGLVELDISQTAVTDLTPLKYSDKLKRLVLAGTPVNDLTVVGQMPALETLDISRTGVLDIAPLSACTSLKYLHMEAAPVSDLQPLAALTALVEVDAAQTLIRDLTPLSGLTKLEVLSLDSTYFQDISALTTLESLKVLSLNHTAVANLRPLQNLKNLERVYCDHTGITGTIADDFMTARPGVLVIFDTEDLQSWWGSLTAEWRNVLSAAADVGRDPSKEELARVTNLDSVNFGGNIAIQSLEPLDRMRKLRAVVAAKTTVSDLSPLRGHRNLRYLDISDTRVEDISLLRNFRELRVFNASNTKIAGIEPLMAAADLERLYIDGTGVGELSVQEFLRRNPECLVVFKTETLLTWWNDMTDDWKAVMTEHVPVREKSLSEDLHRLVELQVLRVSNASVSDLQPLTQFVRLRELHITGTMVSDLSPLAGLTSLRTVKATNSPVRSIEPLAALTDLEEIDISNTPVDDLSPLSQLLNLRKLNCSGTQIMRLDPLEELETLDELDCSNTKVRRLDAVIKLKLKSLKCYNTSISEKRVRDFSQRNPECKIVFY